MPVKAESEALASYWLQQIEAWQSSGQTQQAYCKTNDLSYHRFGYRIPSLSDSSEPFTVNTLITSSFGMLRTLSENS